MKLRILAVAVCCLNACAVPVCEGVDCENDTSNNGRAITDGRGAKVDAGSVAISSDLENVWQGPLVMPETVEVVPEQVFEPLESPELLKKRTGENCDAFRANACMSTLCFHFWNPEPNEGWVCTRRCRSWQGYDYGACPKDWSCTDLFTSGEGFCIAPAGWVPHVAEELSPEELP